MAKWNRGRGLFIVTGLALCSLVIVVSLREHMREQFYMWRLGSHDRAVRHSAAEALLRSGSARSVPLLFRALCATGGNDLHDLSFQTEFRAIVARGQAGIPYLVSRLALDIEQRLMSLRLLYAVTDEIGEGAREAMPRLVELIDSRETEARELTIACLNRIGVDPGVDGIRMLAARLHDVEESVTLRANTLDLLGKTRAASEDVINALIHILEGTNGDLKVMALDVLGQCRVVTTRAVGVVRALCEDQSEEAIKDAARKALRAMAAAGRTIEPGSQ